MKNYPKYLFMMLFVIMSMITLSNAGNISVGGYVSIINDVQYQPNGNLFIVNNNTPSYQIRMQLSDIANHSTLQLFQDRPDHKITFTVSYDNDIMTVFVTQTSASVNTVFQLTTDATVLTAGITPEM